MERDINPKFSTDDLRPLGRTGLAVAPLGLGTVKLGRNEQVKYPRSFSIPDDNQARELLACAHEYGLNLIDTAPAYGTSEARLGRLIKGQRDSWIIASKVGEEFVDGQSVFDFSTQHTRASVERSLKRLNTDRLDIVLVHSDGDDERILNHSGTLDMLKTLKNEGKIRAIGFSPKTEAGAIQAMHTSDVLMLTLNLREQTMKGVLARAHAQEIGVLIKKGLQSGHVASDDRGSSAMAADPIETSFRFIFDQPGVSSIVIGTLSPAHLRHNVTMALRALSATRL